MSACSSLNPTVNHILSCCPAALDQGRLTWHHNSVLNHFVHSIAGHLEVDQHLYADLPGRLAIVNPPATIPPSISSTSDRPELVLVSDAEISILELTIYKNSPSGFNEACKRKETKYASLISDLENRGKCVTYASVLHTIGITGNFTPRMHQEKFTYFRLLSPRTTHCHSF